jgi:hypothetical protein
VGALKYIDPAGAVLLVIIIIAVFAGPWALLSVIPWAVWVLTPVRRNRKEKESNE